MPSPKLTIAFICSAALAGVVGAAQWEAARQVSSGRVGLHDRAVRFAEALEDAAPPHPLAPLVPWLEPAERASPAALAALQTLAVVPGRGLALVLVQVRLAKGGGRGQAEYVLTSRDRTGSGGPILVNWARAPDGTWYLDLGGS